MLNFLLPAAVSAGASLINGSKNRKAQQAANEANTPQAQVAGWEAAGINPIMGITQGQWIPQQAVTMGDSFANAGAALSRGMELNHEEQLAQTGLRKENEELRESLNELSKRREPSNMERFGDRLPIGGSNADTSLSGDDLSLGRSADDVASGRDVEVAPYTSGAGVSEINNNFTGGPVVIPGDDGEPWGLDELGTALLIGGPQVVRNHIGRTIVALGGNNDPIPMGRVGHSMIAPPTPTLSDEFRPDLSDGWRSLFFPTKERN